jgi:hypothetical protein
VPIETSALATALGGRFSPELLFGIGGGTGFGWFTYGDHSTLLTRITTRETGKESFLLDICERLGLEARLSSASSGLALRKRIDAALAGGYAVVVCIPGPAESYGAEHVDLVSDELLERAAALPGAARNRFLAVRPAAVGAADVRDAIAAGIRAHTRQMREGFGPTSTRGSFGLAGFARWRRSLADLDEPARAALREQIQARGGGPAMRLAMAGFLTEAVLPRAAELTRRAAEAWSAVAEEPSPERLAAVEDAEREALAVLEKATSAGRAP